MKDDDIKIWLETLPADSIPSCQTSDTKEGIVDLKARKRLKRIHARIFQHMQDSTTLASRQLDLLKY
jgi:hypothetical protein